VLSNGTLNGFKGLIPVGGQQHPSSGVGANLLWKKCSKECKEE